MNEYKEVSMILRNACLVASILILAFGMILGTSLSVHANGLAPVNLGTAGNFVILAKSGVTTTGPTAVELLI